MFVLPDHNVNINFASDKTSFCKIQTHYKVFSKVVYMICLFCSLLHAIIPKVPNIFVYNSYTFKRHLKKCYSQWAVNDYHLRVGPRRSIMPDFGYQYLDLARKLYVLTSGLNPLSCNVSKSAAVYYCLNRWTILFVKHFMTVLHSL